MPTWLYWIAWFVGRAWRAIVAGTATFALALIASLVLLAWFVAGNRLAAREDARYETLDRIVITPAVGAGSSTITLGLKEFAQNDVSGAAAPRHVRLERRPDQSWRIADASARRVLLLHFADGAEYPTSRFFLHEGDEAVLSNKARLKVVKATSRDDVTLGLQVGTTAPREFHADVDSCGLPAMRDFPVIGDAWRRAWDWVGAQSDRARCALGLAPKEKLVARLGGSVTGTRGGVAAIAIADYRFDGLRITHVRGRGFALAPGWDEEVDLRAKADGDAAPKRFLDLDHDIGTADSATRLDAFTAGRTRYQVQFVANPDQGSGLRITPTLNPHRFRLSDEKIHETDSKGVPKCPGDIDPLRAPGVVIAFCRDLPSYPKSWRYPVRPWSLLLLPVVLLVSAFALRKMFGGVGTGTSVNLWTRAWLGALALTATAAIAPIGAFEATQTTIASPYPAMVAWGVFLATAFFTASGYGASRYLALAVAIGTTGLVAIGSYVFLAMALAAGEFRWASYHNDLASGLTLAATLATWALAMPSGAWDRLARWVIPTSRVGERRRGFHLLVGVCLGVGMVWRAFGDDSGIGGKFQPSELLKTLFVLIFAAGVTSILSENFGGRARRGARFLPLMGQWLLLGLFVVLVLLMFLPVLLNDFSPFLILYLTTLIAAATTMLANVLARSRERWTSPFTYAEPPPDPYLAMVRSSRWTVINVRRRLRGFWREWGVEAMTLAISLTMLAAVAMPFGIVIETPQAARAFLETDHSDWGFMRKIAGRGLSWIELSLQTSESGAAPTINYPDLGKQVMNSRHAIASAPCRWRASELAPDFAASAAGALDAWMDEAVGEACRAAAPNVSTLTPAADFDLPEIQNDFVGAWAIHVLGRDGAFLLTVYQFAFIALLFACAFLMMQWRSGDDQRRGVSTFFANATIGFAIMILVHFGISWMNTFGLLPVMGQPMTFLAQGRSHLIAFAVPAILTPIIGLGLSGAAREGRRFDVWANLPAPAGRWKPYPRLLKPEPRLIRTASGRA